MYTYVSLSRSFSPSLCFSSARKPRRAPARENTYIYIYIYEYMNIYVYNILIFIHVYKHIRISVSFSLTHTLCRSLSLAFARKPRRAPARVNTQIYT